MRQVLNESFLHKTEKTSGCRMIMLSRFNNAVNKETVSPAFNTKILLWFPPVERQGFYATACSPPKTITLPGMCPLCRGLYPHKPFTAGACVLTNPQFFTPAFAVFLSNISSSKIHPNPYLCAPPDLG